MTTYFSVTTTISAHRISESTPSTACGVASAAAAAGGDDGLAQRVERAGADVAVDDADAAEHQRLEAGGGMRFAMTVGRRRFRRGDRTFGLTWELGLDCLLQLHNCRSGGLILPPRTHRLAVFGPRYASNAWIGEAYLKIVYSHQIVTCVPTSTTRPVGIWK